MAKALQLSNTITANQERAISAAVQAEAEQLPFWETLSAAAKRAVLKGSTNMASATLSIGMNRLRQGEALYNIQQALLPYDGAWTQFLKRMSVGNGDNKRLLPVMAYRLISGYKTAIGKFHPHIIEAAILTGTDIIGVRDDHPFGKYTAAVKKLPPPATPTPEQSRKYLGELEEKRRSLGAKGATKGESLEEVLHDPAFLKKQSFRVVRNSMKQVPAHSRKRWLADVIGMLMTEAGVKVETPYMPKEVPEEFSQGKGRPKLVVQAEIDGATIEASA